MPAVPRRSSRGLHRRLSALGDDVALGDLVALELAHDAAVIEHRRRGRSSRSARRSRSSRTGSAVPCVGELAQQPVDLLLGADVDAARRVVEQDDARRSVISHLAMTTFCWLPPDSVATGVGGSADLDRELASTISSIACALRLAVDDEPRVERARARPASRLSASTSAASGPRSCGPRGPAPCRVAPLGLPRAADATPAGRRRGPRR